MMIKYIFLFTLMASSCFAVQQKSQVNPNQNPLQSTTTPAEPKKAPYRMPKLVIPPGDVAKHIPQGDLFIYPGIVGVRNSQWVGSDNFVNISKSMAVQVNIVKPEDVTLSFKSEAIKAKVTDILAKSGITLTDSGVGNKPPLPFFNVMVMIYPIDEGFAAVCQGRLFEEVDIKRVIIDPETVFQAITWMQMNLIVAPENELEKLLIESVDGIANNFVKKLAAYQTPKNP